MDTRHCEVARTVAIWLLKVAVTTFHQVLAMYNAVGLESPKLLRPKALTVKATASSAELPIGRFQVAT